MAGGRDASVASGVGMATAALVMALVLVPLATPAGASGGGGCGGPVTEASGQDVKIRGFCFKPTILHVRPQHEVTWTNRDLGVPHNVQGANATWGSFEWFKRGHISFRFTTPGVYPYVCMVHPGMVGAVVVGKGESPKTVSLASLGTRARPALAQAPQGEPSALGWKVTAAIALGLFLLTLAAARERRRVRGGSKP